MNILSLGSKFVTDRVHSYKCYIKACIIFNTALFSVFSGPLFANVEGYVYLDLMIWGLSPLVFLGLKGRLVRYLKKGKNQARPSALKMMIICVFIQCLSFPFLNYSIDFNWNYFSRTFNLDMGYFVFDFTMRTLDLLIELEEEDLQGQFCPSLCGYQFTTMTIAYFWVFILSSTFDINERNNGPTIFALACLISFITLVSIPIIYYLKNKHHFKQPKYQELQPEEDEQNMFDIADQDGEQLNIQPPSVIRKAIGVTFITTSLLLNMNYFSLWMMQPLGTTSESPYQQYNITVQMVSYFFLLSTMGYLASYYLFVFSQKMRYFFKTFLFFYGFALILCYWMYKVQYVSLLILGFGVHQMCVIQFKNRLQQLWKFGLQFTLYNQVFSYFALPLIYTILNIGQESLNAYAFTSGIFLAVGALLL